MIEVQQNSGGTADQQNLYAALDQKLRNSAFDGSAAQAHGIACGLVCRNIQSAELEQTAQHLNFYDDGAITALESLMEMSTRDLNQAEFSFDLWMPDDDDLAIQLGALADWSQGFVIGLLHDGNAVLEQLSPELQESVQDIIQIAGLEATQSDTNEDAIAFIEIKEYLRMATQLIFEEFNADRPLDAVAE